MLKKVWNKLSGCRKKLRVALLVPALIFLLAPSASPGDEPCLMCHEGLSKEKVVHAALSLGCVTCHSALDVKDVPHKVTGKVPKGLSSEQPELCYGCHDKAAFTKKVVHAALGIGCTGCHNPHSSKNAKLLLDEEPELCFRCHDKSKFEGKVTHTPVTAGSCLGCHNPHSGDHEKLLLAATQELCFLCHEKTDFIRPQVHMPVGMGLCMTCHVPHAGDGPSLLTKSINALCKECHKTQGSGKHVTAGFRKGEHPVENKPDPSSPGKTMSCVSCHRPHSAEGAKLFVMRGVCKKCHKY